MTLSHPCCYYCLNVARNFEIHQQTFEEYIWLSFGLWILKLKIWLLIIVLNSNAIKAQKISNCYGSYCNNKNHHKLNLKQVGSGSIFGIFYSLCIFERNWYSFYLYWNFLIWRFDVLFICWKFETWFKDICEEFFLAIQIQISKLDFDCQPASIKSKIEKSSTKLLKLTPNLNLHSDFWLR